MQVKLTISEFIKLARTTKKTLLYYHKIGILREPERSNAGYRLYGIEELIKMQEIKKLKNLGMNLSQIKEIVGEHEPVKSLDSVLSILKENLLNEKVKIETQLLEIEKLLENHHDKKSSSESYKSDTFKQVAQILNINEEDSGKNRQDDVFEIIEGFNWGHDYQNNFIDIAEYFKNHPDEYEKAKELGERLDKLKNMSTDDPEIERLAKEGAEFIVKIPLLKERLYGQMGLGEKNEELINDMVRKVLSPAQIKHKELIQKYLNYKV